MRILNAGPARDHTPRSARASHRPRIGVAAPGQSYSETYIRHHVENLPADVLYLFGDILPTHQGDGAALLSDSVAARLFRGAHRTIRGWEPNEALRRSVAAALRNFGAQAILAEYGPTGAELTPVAEALRIPLIVHFHGKDAFEHALLERNKGKYHRMFAVASTLVVVSRPMMEQLIELGAPREKVALIPCGVDTAVFQGASPGHAPRTFVAVGRFIDKKSPLLTLLAFHRAQSAVPDARLVMAGEGPLLEACRHVARGLRMENSVRLLGVQTPLEILAWFRQARAFVHHSVHASSGDAEGTPVSILEASSCGLPVVSTRHMGIPEAVLDRVTGRLVDEYDVDGMADAIVAFAENPALAACMGQAGREHVQANYSQTDSTQRLWRAIESAMRSR